MTICPCCGTDIVVDQPIVMNDFSMHGAGFPLFYRGKRVPLTHDQALVCWALMKAHPMHLTRSAIGERLGYDGDGADRLIMTQVCKIRAAFDRLGMPQPIETMHGHYSYRWDPARS